MPLERNNINLLIDFVKYLIDYINYMNDIQGKTYNEVKMRLLALLQYDMNFDYLSIINIIKRGHSQPINTLKLRVKIEKYSS